MIYIYTQDKCPRCIDLKRYYNAHNVKFTERDASRLKMPEDDIDREALIEAAMVNMELPIIVDKEGEQC